MAYPKRIVLRFEYEDESVEEYPFTFELASPSKVKRAALRAQRADYFGVWDIDGRRVLIDNTLGKGMARWVADHELGHALNDATFDLLQRR